MRDLQPYIDEGLLSARKHPDLDLWVINYTAITQYERRWDDITLNHRGRVVNAEGETITPCLPKFFNYEEHLEIESLPDVPFGQKFIAYEKVDGSYISVTNHPDYDELIVASRGSFESDQAAWAREVIEDRKYDFPEGYSFIFELIHPKNRIVVDYGETHDLVLLAFFDGENEVPLFDVAHDHEYCKLDTNQFRWAAQINADNLDDLLNDDQENFEGYVVWFENGLRVKVKLDEYVRIHKVVTNLTPRKVFDAVQEDRLEEILDVLPDEYFDWVKLLALDIRYEFSHIRERGIKLAEEAKSESDSRKDQAAYILSNDKSLAPLAFAHLDNKQLDDTCWKLTRREFETWDTKQ